MNLILQIIFPIIIYSIYACLDSLHTLALLRPPGTQEKCEGYKDIANVEYANNFRENTLEFLRSESSFVKTMFQDIALLDLSLPSTGFTWPFIKPYNIPADFINAYQEGKSKWWIGKTVGFAVLFVIVLLFSPRFTRRLFPEPWGTFLFTFVSCTSLVMLIGYSKLISRLVYRLFLYAIMWVIVLVAKASRFLNAIFKAAAESLEKVFKEKPTGSGLEFDELSSIIDSDVVKPLSAHQIDAAVEDVVDKVRNIDVQAILQQKRKTVYMKPDVEEVLNEVRKKHNDVHRQFIVDLLQKLVVPEVEEQCEYGSKLAYNIDSHPFGSLIRFLMLDRRGTYLMIVLLVLTYVIAGGYSFAGWLIVEELDDDRDALNDEDTQSGPETYIGLFTVTIIAIVYMFIYGAILAAARQTGLMILSRLGSMKKDIKTKAPVKSVGSAVFNEIIEFSHVFKLPDRVTFKQPMIGLLKEIAYYSTVIPILSLLLVCAYMFICGDGAADEEDKGKRKLAHYVEATKTLSMIAGSCLVVYFVAKSVLAKTT